ncbi:hypothetical protein DYB32_006591 [Aphanomyces invadans]|uniref:Uncharacterized protein n=1 Tax=Aphanomyces invadans TaxID=157072 RepID=A0A418AR86_9STRA|nr:hypothetical protein DYB32_006591 [Aphanomyces invadans]
MNQATLERDDVLVKCVHLAQTLQLTFPTKQPHMYDTGDAAYLPHVVQTLTHTQALPMEILATLTFVANVYQQLEQSHYVEPNVLQSVLYHMQVPPLSAFVQPTQYPMQFHLHHPHHHHHHHPYVSVAPSTALFMPPPQQFYSNSFAPLQPHYVVASPHHGMSAHPVGSTPLINQMESPPSPTAPGYVCPPQQAVYHQHPHTTEEHANNHPQQGPQHIPRDVMDHQRASFSPRFVSDTTHSTAPSALVYESSQDDSPALDAFPNDEAFLCRHFTDDLLPFDFSACRTSTPSLTSSPSHHQSRPETNYTFSKDISLDIRRHLEEEQLFNQQAYGHHENSSDEGNSGMDRASSRCISPSPSHAMYGSTSFQPITDITAQDEDLYDAALELRFQPFLDSLTHDDDDVNGNTATGNDVNDQQPQDSDTPSLHHEMPTSSADQHDQQDLQEQQHQLLQPWLGDEQNNVVCTASGDAASVTSSSNGSEEAEVSTRPLPSKDQKGVQLKRRYLYDAPTPLEIQKQSVQIHMQTTTDRQQDRAATAPSATSSTTSLPSAEDVVAVTTTWISRMHGQGHCFDDKARQKFQELVAVDPFRAVGITVSFDIRKDTIQNKSAWLARACFNCQRKHHPSTMTTKSTSSRKALPPKTTPNKTTTTSRPK